MNYKGTKSKTLKGYLFYPFSIPRQVTCCDNPIYDPVHSCDIHNQTTQYSFMVFVPKNTYHDNFENLLEKLHIKINYVNML
jgi:hypothetical protein